MMPLDVCSVVVHKPSDPVVCLVVKNGEYLAKNALLIPTKTSAGVDGKIT